MRKFMSFGIGLLVGAIVTGTWFMTQTTANSATRGPDSATMNPTEMMLNTTNLPVQGHIDAF